MITIIGNSLNSTNKKVLDKMNKMDLVYIEKESQSQLSHGAEFIELNAVSLLGNEISFIKEAIQVIEGIGGKVFVRSNNIETLLEVAKIANNEIILGDIEFDIKKIDPILEVANHDKVKIIALVRENGSGV